MDYQRLLFILSVLFLSYNVLTAPVPKNGFTTEDAEEKLIKYGYINKPPNGSRTGRLPVREMTSALISFQNMAAIPETGVLDELTIQYMMMPRCGNCDCNRPDVQGPVVVRSKRWVKQGSNWKHSPVKYQITKYPESRSLSRFAVDMEIKRAFKMWSDVADIDFIRVQSNPDIEILFAKYDHGDNSPFDGRGGVLAHAFFPQYGGDCHFDGSENLTINTTRGIDIFTVAAHEFGHSLGLSHSKNRNALMYAYYRGYIENYKLHEDDIKGIQAIYGKRRNIITTTRRTQRPRPTPPTVPPVGPRHDACLLPKADAVMYSQRQKKTYIFSGQWYWRLNSENTDPGYPRRISTDWGIHSKVDCTLSTSDDRFYIFSGAFFYRFQGMTRLDNGIQIGANGYFTGLPYHLDSAFVWSGNNQVYFTKGQDYYRLTDSVLGGPLEKRRVAEDYPRSLRVWGGVPNAPDSAVQWMNGRTYFFKGSVYWRFDDARFSVDENYPKPIDYWWLQCQNGRPRSSANLVTEGGSSR